MGTMGMGNIIVVFLMIRTRFRISTLHGRSGETECGLQALPHWAARLPAQLQTAWLNVKDDDDYDVKFLGEIKPRRIKMTTMTMATTMSSRMVLLMTTSYERWLDLHWSPSCNLHRLWASSSGSPKLLLVPFGRRRLFKVQEMRKN